MIIESIIKKQEVLLRTNIVVLNVFNTVYIKIKRFQHTLHVNYADSVITVNFKRVHSVNMYFISVVIAS